jgi:hypothetical protein
VVDLKYQLGNQLFQFAAAKQLELDGASILFSDRTKRQSGTASIGLTKMEQFIGTTVPLASTIQELATGYLPRTVFNSPFVDFVLSSPIILPFRRRIFTTPDFGPKPTSMPEWSLYRIQGYFQHRSWFDRSLSSVIASLEETTRGTRTSLPSFDVCVHLRRGDYLSHGWELSFDYYVRCLELMSIRFLNVVVTSDDPLTAMTFALYLNSKGYDAHTPEQVASLNGGTSQRHLDPVLHDFCLMANAKNVIMSNSTFCWWATTLGDSVNQGYHQRIVAYPRGWVGFLDDESDGLAQPSWQQVPRK